MDGLPVAELINLGTNGLALLMLWSIIKMNERLLMEISQHNELLLNIIDRLLEDR